MLRITAVLLVLASLAVAAPVPKESEAEKIKKAFGEIVDPDKDCKFKLDGEKLVLTMPGGKRYDYWDEKLPGKPSEQEKPITNCPRVLREAEGDFVITVRVTAALPKDPEAAEGKMAEAGAGLFIMNDKQRVWRSGMHDFAMPGKDRNLMAIIPGSHGPAGFQLTAGKPGAGLYVRMKRQAGKLSPEFSGDGKKWQGGITMTVDKEEKVKVGVYGFSNSKADTTVTFENFSVEAAKAEEKK